MSDRPIRYIVVHHGAAWHGDTASEVVEKVREIHKAKGWRDIGYHFVIAKDGSQSSARPMNLDAVLEPWERGAQAKGINSISIGVLFDGNFMETTPSQAQITNGSLLIAKIILNIVKNGGEIPGIIGHRDAHNIEPTATRTACPGDMFPFSTILKNVALVLGDKGAVRI